MKLLPLRFGDSFGLVDLAGNVVISPEFRWADESLEGIAVVKTFDDTTILIDTSTLQRYPMPGWKDPGEFSHGLLSVEQAGVPDPLVGYANRFGEIVIPPKFRLGLPFDRTGAIVSVAGDGSRQQRINFSGEFMGRQYLQILRFHPEGLYSGARLDLFDHWPDVLVNGFGEQIGTQTYQEVWQEHEGLIPVAFVYGEVGWIDTDGREVYRLKSTGIGVHFESGLVPVEAANEKWGLMDVDGRWQIDPEFDIVAPVGRDRFMFGWRDAQENPTVRLADSQGCYLGEESFEWIGSFQENVAMVQRQKSVDDDDDYASESNYIDREGRLLLPRWN